VRDFAEQRGRHRQIKGADAVAVSDLLFQQVEAGAADGVRRDIGKSVEKRFQFLGVDVFLGDVLGNRLLGEGPEFRVAHLAARRADDASRFRKLMIALAVVERRQKLALRQIAGTTEYDEVERVDGNDLACHGLSVLTRAGMPGLL
jgi:hypothetical protein